MALLLVSLGVLYIRWSTLQQRIPLIADNIDGISTTDDCSEVTAGRYITEEDPPKQQENDTDYGDPAISTININTAGSSELEGLPGIGPVLAGRIIEYRERCGPFAAVDGLLQVEGIGPSKLNDIRELIDVRSGS